MLDVDGLVSHGFFRHVTPGELAAAVAQARAENWPFVDAAKRLIHADAESLAELGVRLFLGRVTPFLERAGVAATVTYVDMDGGTWQSLEKLAIAFRRGERPTVIADDEDDDGKNYFVYVGKRKVPVYRETDPPDASWDLATRMTLALLNEILEGNRSEERAYAVWGGNGLHIAFVTPVMRAIINAGVDRDRALTA